MHLRVAHIIDFILHLFNVSNAILCKSDCNTYVITVLERTEV